MLRYLGKVTFNRIFPNGCSARFYGTSLSRKNNETIIEDWATLFNLLEEDKIKPIITAKYPIYEAAAANRLLESGKVSGNIVLAAEHYL